MTTTAVTEQRVPVGGVDSFTDEELLKEIRRRAQPTRRFIPPVAGQTERETWHNHQKQLARKLVTDFFKELEEEGFEAHAIIGIPNWTILGRKLDGHIESCEECRAHDKDGELCEAGWGVADEDQKMAKVLVFRTDGAGEKDEPRLTKSLMDMVRGTSLYDLVGDAEPVLTISKKKLVKEQSEGFADAEVVRKTDNSPK